MNAHHDNLRSRCSVQLVFLLILCGVTTSRARVLDLQGQASAWFAAAKTDSLRAACGARYIPSLGVELPVTQTLMIDAEISCNACGYLEGIRSVQDYDSSDYAIDPYRLWARVSGSQFELRGGLQKISFGSATIFRPLMWFDQIDVRDPLRITEGVYAMLFRYYFLNNMNIWMWGLYGNEEVKGWEAYPTDSGNVEYGGRVQIPLFSGECGVSYHHRNASLSDISLDPVPESRIGVDGKWDVGVGLWLEGAVVRTDLSGIPEAFLQQYPLLRLDYQRYICAGLDYTFGIGNGVYALVEHFLTDLSDEAWGSTNESQQLSAVSLRYSIGTLDELSGVVYYDWDKEEIYRYGKWTRTYDRWMINLIGFWNPEAALYDRSDSYNTLLGRGIQLIIAYNH
jgi:hypothetical protein